MVSKIGLAYLAWYAFVFAMCYCFSPWFAFLLILTPTHKDFRSEKKEETSEKTNDNQKNGENDTTE